MRKLLNTLYVSTEGAYLHRDGLNVVVEVEHVEKLRVPLHLLSGVAVFGQVSLSPALMGSLAEAGVSHGLLRHERPLSCAGGRPRLWQCAAAARAVSRDG